MLCAVDNLVVKHKFDNLEVEESRVSKLTECGQTD